MSGHSKWANIKTRKEAQDKKRAQIFTKLIRTVSVAAREGGADPDTNAKLKLAVERARAFNVPKENIERAIRREGSEAIEAFTLDAIGPGGAALIIDGTTDNRNRTTSEIRSILDKHGGKLAQAGGTRWTFTRRGIIVAERTGDPKTDESRLLTLIGLGAEDVRERGDVFEIIVPAETLEPIRCAMTEKGLAITDASLGWVPQQMAALDEPQREALAALVEELDDHPDVQDVWTNESRTE